MCPSIAGTLNDGFLQSHTGRMNCGTRGRPRPIMVFAFRLSARFRHVENTSTALPFKARQADFYHLRRRHATKWCGRLNGRAADLEANAGRQSAHARRATAVNLITSLTRFSATSYKCRSSTHYSSERKLL